MSLSRQDVAALLRRGLHRHSCAGKLNAAEFSLASAVFSAAGVWKFNRVSVMMVTVAMKMKETPLHALLQTKSYFFGKRTRGRRKKKSCQRRFCLDLPVWGASGETAVSLSTTSQTLDLCVQGASQNRFSFTDRKSLSALLHFFFSSPLVGGEIRRGEGVVIWAGQNTVVPVVTALRCASVSSHRR